MTAGLTLSRSIKKIECLEISAPLGLRFWDPLTQRTVGDELAVTIYPQQNSTRRAEATPNRSGIYVFHRIPGFDTLPDQSRNFIVEVDDLLARFLPFQLTFIRLPGGLFHWACPALSQGEAAPLLHIPLFSNPSRIIPAGMAIVRADLRQWVPDQESGLPAAWAVLSVLYKDKLLARGLASREGSVMVPFPFPPPPISSTGPSGLLNDPISISQQVWNVSLRVQFYPSDQVPQTVPERPDLCEVISHPQVTPLGTLSPLEPLGPLAVCYARETIAKTEHYSELYFTNP